MVPTLAQGENRAAADHEPAQQQDRDLEAVERLIRSGSLLAAVESVCGLLE